MPVFELVSAYYVRAGFRVEGLGHQSANIAAVKFLTYDPVYHQRATNHEV